MVDVIISCPSEEAFTAQIKDQASSLIAFSPVQRNELGEDVLGDTMFFRSFPGANGPQPLPASAASIATYRVKYRTVDVVRNQDGEVTIPAQHSPNTYFYIRMTETDWDALLASTNPTGRLKGAGGAQIVYAYGFEGGATWGDEPANGIQMVWASE